MKIIFALIMVLTTFMVSCGSKEEGIDISSKIAEVTDFYTSYIESRYTASVDYIDYLYEVSEDERQLMEDSIDVLLDYEIRSVKQINENLYEVICFVKSSYIPKATPRK